MIGAALDRFDRVIKCVVRGHNDDRCLRPLCFDLIENFQTLDVRELQIEKDKRRRFIFQRLESGGRGGGCFGFKSVPTQQGFERKQDRSLVVDDEDSATLFHETGKVTLVTSVDVARS